MGIFKKKKESEDEAEEKDQKEQPKKTNKRRKKENLPKPWDRKERLLVFYLFTGTIIASGLLALSARSWKLPHFPRFSISSLNPFKSQVIELGGKSTSEDKLLAEKVVKEFDKMTSNLSGVYGLFVMDLTKDYYFGENENEKFDAASIVKLPVMVAMYKMEEKKEIDLDEAYFLKEEDKVGGAGSLQYKDAGYEISYRNLLKKMGQESDNTAFKIVKNKVGNEKINEILKELSMDSTDVETFETSPSDIGMLFQQVWNGDVLNKEDAQEFFDFLTDTGFEEHLPEGLPDGKRMAHKVGFEVHVVNDGGIVFADNPYVIVVMGKGVVESEAKEVFPLISKLVYDSLNP